MSLGLAPVLIQKRIYAVKEKQFRAGVTNPWFMDWYRSLGHLVSVHSDRIINLLHLKRIILFSKNSESISNGINSKICFISFF